MKKEYTPQQWANYWKKRYTEQAEKYPYCIVCKHISNDAGYFSNEYFRAKTKDVKETCSDDQNGSAYDTFRITHIVALFKYEEEMLEAYDKIYEPKIIKD